MGNRKVMKESFIWFYIKNKLKLIWLWIKFRLLIVLEIVFVLIIAIIERLLQKIDDEYRIDIEGGE